MGSRKGGAYVNLSGLRDRGWTAGMIRDLLGKPDRVVANPAVPGGPDVRLYGTARVAAAERRAAFRRGVAEAERRGAVARGAARRRWERMLRVAAGDEITVPRLPAAVLTARAVRHRDDHDGAPSDPSTADRATLDRWKVNYLRHQLVGYDGLLDGLFGDRGRVEAERALRRRLYSAIWEAYPELVGECERQLRAREEDG